MPHPIIDRHGVLSADALTNRVSALRGALAERGVRPGTRVLLVVANERESVAAFHAVVDLGATAVLTQTSAGLSELRVACEVAAPDLAVVSPDAPHLVPELAEVLPTVLSTDLDGPPTPAHSDVDPDAPRVVTFTSGTTSRPKGVVHSARSLEGTLACFVAMTGLTSDDAAFLVSPLASITGVTQALALAPALGMTVVLESAFDNERSLDFLLETGATFYGGPDVVIDRLLTGAAARGVEVPLRLAALGGTMLRRELLERAEAAGVSVIRVYGSSEVPWSTGTRVSEHAEARLADEGTPGPGVEIRLSDDETNELLIRGPHLFRGYLGDDGDDPLEGGWFRTGDEAQLINGRLRIVGRLKDVASRNGKKISLAEVDEHFRTASGISEVAAFIVQDDATGERVAMAVAVPAGTQIEVPHVLDTMQGAGLARFKLPESVVRWEGDLPLTATGKVQRRLLDENREVLWCAPRLSTPPA